MVPKYIGWRFGAELDGTGQIYRATLVHVQIWSAQYGGRRNWKRKEGEKKNKDTRLNIKYSHCSLCRIKRIPGGQKDRDKGVTGRKGEKDEQGKE